MGLELAQGLKHVSCSQRTQVQCQPRQVAQYHLELWFQELSGLQLPRAPTLMCMHMYTHKIKNIKLNLKNNREKFSLYLNGLNTTVSLTEWKLMGNFKLSHLPALDTRGKAAALRIPGTERRCPGHAGSTGLPGISAHCFTCVHSVYSGDRTHIRIQSLFLFHLYHNYIQRLTVVIIKTFKIFYSYGCMCACVWVFGEVRRGCHSWSWSYRGCKSALHAGTNSGPLQKQCHLTSPLKMVMDHYSVPRFQCDPPHGVRRSVLRL